MNDSPIIHIGYPKTATTWFQNHFYTKQDESFFLTRKQVIDYIINVNGFVFDVDKARDKLLGLSEGKRVIICEELLLGGLDIPFGNGEFIMVMAERIKRLFPNAQIIMFIRRQDDILASAYFQYIRSGGTYPLEKYLGFTKPFDTFYKNYMYYSPDFFIYHRLISYFGSLFGEKNVYTYLYEEFREDNHAFLTRFINAHKLKPIQISSTETKTNRRFAKPLISFMRLANHLYRKNTLRKNYLVNLPFLYPTILHICLFLNKYTIFHALSKTKNIFGAQQVSLINSYYLESNNRLQALLGKDKLVKYHYIDEK